MREIAMIALIDNRGWLLLQERDEYAPTEPEKWCLVGGAVEEGESPTEAAHRELEEETSISADLIKLGHHDLPCAHHGRDLVHLYGARTSLTDDDIVCGEGRQIVFVDPRDVAALDLSELTLALLPVALAQG